MKALLLDRRFLPADGEFGLGFVLFLLNRRFLHEKWCLSC